jgi:proteic killer suppression protein
MKVIYGQQYLKELHQNKKTTDKKHRYQPSVIKKYIKIIDLMIEAKTIQDIVRINSLRYEKLLGNKQGVSSVRVNDKYRIEFEEHFEKGQAFATICNIIELSNHYN